MSSSSLFCCWVFYLVWYKLLLLILLFRSSWVRQLHCRDFKSRLQPLCSQSGNTPLFWNICNWSRCERSSKSYWDSLCNSFSPKGSCITPMVSPDSRSPTAFSLTEYLGSHDRMGKTTNNSRPELEGGHSRDVKPRWGQTPNHRLFCLTSTELSPSPEATVSSSLRGPRGDPAELYPHRTRGSGEVVSPRWCPSVRKHYEPLPVGP